MVNNGKVKVDLLKAAEQSFVQGMVFRYIAAKYVSHNDPVLAKEESGFHELFGRSVSADAGEANKGGEEIAQVRTKLLGEYLDRNNKVVDRVGELQAERHPLERSVDSINRWTLVFLVLAILYSPERLIHLTEKEHV
jgi:hypothetical protein